MSGRALSLGFALAAMLAAVSAGPAAAANILEENFFMTGPRYDGVVPPCEFRLRAEQDQRPLCAEGRYVLEFDAHHQRF